MACGITVDLDAVQMPIITAIAVIALIASVSIRRMGGRTDLRCAGTDTLLLQRRLDDVAHLSVPLNCSRLDTMTQKDFLDDCCLHSFGLVT